MTLAALALQIPEWSHPINDVTTPLMSGASPRPDAALEFVAIFADELDNPRLPVARSRRDQVQSYMRQTGWPYLSTILASQFAQSDPRASGRGMACLTAWMQAKTLDASVLVESGFVQFAFNALATMPSLFEEAVNVVCEMIPLLARASDQLRSAMEASVVGLEQALWAAAAEEDEDVVRGLGRVIIEAGYAYAVDCHE